MKKFFLLVALCISITTLRAQDLNIKWGQEFDSRTDVQAVLGYSGDKLVDFSLKLKKRYLRTFDRTTGEKLSSNVFTLPKVDNKALSLLNIGLSEGNVTLILYNYIKKTGSFTLYSQNMDLNGKHVGDLTEIYTSSDGSKMSNRKVDTRQESGKMVIYYDRTDKKKLQFFSDNIVLDLANSAKVMNINKLNFKMRDAKSEDVNYSLKHFINKKGELSFIKQKTEYAKKKVSNFSLFVSKYDINGKLIGEAEISEPGHILTSSTLSFQDDKIAVVGYYKVKGKKDRFYSGYSGLFYSELSSDVKVLKTTLNRFSDEFFVKLYRQKKIDRMNKKGTEITVPAPYAMKNIVTHSDNSITLVSEYYTKRVTQSQGRKTTTWTYGSIIYYKLDVNGKLYANDVVPKLQMTSKTSQSMGLGLGPLTMFISIESPGASNTKYWSYFSIAVGDKVFLLFNDHFKNLDDGEEGISKALTNPKKGIPYLVTIEKDGSFTKKGMVSSGDTETYLVPRVTRRTGGGTFVIWGIWKKTNKYGFGEVK